ncbi:hypothetical protein Trydic_g3605 [Trypoxylus dichotomus]
MNLVAEIKAGIRLRSQVMVALLDIEKAYDKVWREALLHKMANIGIPWQRTKLIQNWLTDRSFQVKIKNCYSSVRPANQGLPQGFPLSPVLFNIYLWDVPKFHWVDGLSVFQFADDTAIVSTAKKRKLNHKQKVKKRARGNKEVC